MTWRGWIGEHEVMAQDKSGAFHAPYGVPGRAWPSSAARVVRPPGYVDVIDAAGSCISPDVGGVPPEHAGGCRASMATQGRWAYNGTRYSQVLILRWQMDVGAALSLPSPNCHGIKASLVPDNSHDESARGTFASGGSTFRVGPVNSCRCPERVMARHESGAFHAPYGLRFVEESG